MSAQPATYGVKRIPIQNAASSNKVVITPQFKKIVDTLHEKVGNIEWSGYMYYSAEGEHGKQTFTPKLLFLQDVGTAAYTSFTASPAEIAEFFSRNPEAETLICGKIHTHHTLSLGTAFSGTDDEDLQEACENYRDTGYLSLIVHKTSNYNAKIAYAINKKESYEFCSTHEEESNKSLYVKEEKVCLALACKVEISEEAKTLDEETLYWLEKIRGKKNTYGTIRRIGFGATSDEDDNEYAYDYSKWAAKNQANQGKKSKRADSGMEVLMRALFYYFKNQNFVTGLPIKCGYVRFAEEYGKRHVNTQFSTTEFYGVFRKEADYPTPAVQLEILNEIIDFLMETPKACGLALTDFISDALRLFNTTPVA